MNKLIIKNKKVLIVIAIVLIIVIALFIMNKNNMDQTNSDQTSLDQTNSDQSSLGQSTSDQTNNVLIKTSMGEITLELYPDKAPITVENFLVYVNEGNYDNTVFHRVIKGFMIQGGGFTEDGSKKPTNAQIKLESDNGLKNEIGTIAMARTADPNSATNQFFINTANNIPLNKGVRDDGYAVFGKVTKGLDVVYKIENSKTTVKQGMSDWPVNDVKILSIKVL